MKKIKVLDMYLCRTHVNFCHSHVRIECTVTCESVIRFWQWRHQKKSEDVTYLKMYKSLLWLLRFWPKMATLKRTSRCHVFTLTASHVHRREQTTCDLNLWEILFPTTYNLLIKTKYLCKSNTSTKKFC